MLTIGLPALIALVGALLYGFAANGKAAEIGRILFFVGALWAVYALAGAGAHLRIS